ncbi:MAG: hypothetical protein GDA54_05325 [Alphaproteobacteria bacterium GM7ARS4]|nr:hypothetical protein [Alphaproteobacteria bacterium GM7ARS4]
MNTMSPHAFHRLGGQHRPFLIKEDRQGRFHVKRYGLIGRFKVALRQRLGMSSSNDSLKTHHHFSRFLRAHYGERLAGEALQEANVSHPTYKHLTLHQARQALSYAQSHRFQNIVYHREQVGKIIPSTPEQSPHYRLLVAACATMTPPVEPQKLTSSQWAYVRASLARCLNMEGHHGKVRVSDDRAIILASRMMAQAHALGGEACELINGMRDSLHRCSADIFCAMESGDISAVTRDMGHFDAQLQALKAQEMKALAPDASKHIEAFYHSDTGAPHALMACLEDSVTAQKHDNFYFAQMEMHLAQSAFPDAFQHAMAQIRRSGMMSSLHPGAEQTLQRCEAMMVRMRAHIEQQIYALMGKDDPRLAGMQARFVQESLDKGLDHVRKGLTVPNNVALGENGQDKRKSLETLTFMQKGIEAAMSQDKAVLALQKAKDVEKEVSRRDDASIPRIRQVRQQTQAVYQELLASQGPYMRLLNTMHDMRQALAARKPQSSVHRQSIERDVEALDTLLDMYDPHKAHAIPQGSKPQWQEDTLVFVTTKTSMTPEQKAFIQKFVTPPPSRKAWDHDGRVSKQFAADLVRQTILLDDKGEKKDLCSPQDVQKAFPHGLTKLTTDAIDQLEAYVGNKEDTFFISELLNQTLGNAATGAMQNGKNGVLVSKLSGQGINFAQVIEDEATSLQKREDGGFSIDYEAAFKIRALSSEEGTQEVRDNSRYRIAYRVDISPEELAQKRFTLREPQLSFHVAL